VFPIILTTQGSTEPSHSGRDRKSPGNYDKYDTCIGVKAIDQSSSDHNYANRNNHKHEHMPE